MKQQTFPSYKELNSFLNEHFKDLGHAASHWSQLYEGGSKLIILIDEQEQLDKIIELEIQGEFKDVKMRAGEAHWQEGGMIRSLEWFDCTLDELKDDFYSQHTMYDHQNWILSNEKEFNEHFRVEETGEIKSNGNVFNGEGMYDEYGNLIIGKGDTSYTEDVYTYRIAFIIDQEAMVDEDGEKEFRIFDGHRSIVSNDDVRRGKI